MELFKIENFETPKEKYTQRSSQSHWKILGLAAFLTTPLAIAFSPLFLILSFALAISAFFVYNTKEHKEETKSHVKKKSDEEILVDIRREFGDEEINRETFLDNALEFMGYDAVKIKGAYRSTWIINKDTVLMDAGWFGMNGIKDATEEARKSKIDKICVIAEDYDNRIKAVADRNDIQILKMRMILKSLCEKTKNLYAARNVSNEIRWNF